MISQHSLLYLGARLFAAAANLAALAVFTRLAGSDVYGGYLLVFSWAFVIYGFLGQWLGAAFFAVYQQDGAAAQIAAFGRLVSGSVCVAGIVIASGAAVGITTWPVAGALFLVVGSLVLFISTMEAERTRLEARTVSIILVLRSILVISCGAVALESGGGALALACAIAIANIVGALPGLARLAPHLLARSSMADARRFFAYGWPLIIAFGATALGQNVDRLVLAHVGGTAELGPYGATSDFLKQGFGVVGEAIALAAVSIAKNAMISGDHATARRTLEDTFRALTATVSFGAVFIMIFADQLVRAVFGPQFHDMALALVPSLIIVNALLIFRAFYFGQAIYFGQSSRNEAIAATLMLTVTATLSLVLVPRFGAFGAAWAATGGQFAACCVFVMARPRLPIPLGSLFGIAASAAAVLAVAKIVDEVAIASLPVGLGIKLMVFAAGGMFVMWHFRILGLWDYAGAIATGRSLAQPIGPDNARIADSPWP